jgi:predicted nucleotidyltransferase
MNWDPRITQLVSQQPYPLLYMTISGAHLYGFPSPDSDYDLRGIHLLPLPRILGLQLQDETIERTQVVEGLELDLVTHDARSAFNLLLKKSGNMLESIFSPLVVTTSDAHEELKSLVPACITRHFAHHYLGFAESQWKMFAQESPRRVKPLLYTFRVLMTGIVLMRTGKVEANVLRLNQSFRLPYVENLVVRKLAGPEQSVLKDADVEFYQSEYRRLRTELDAAYQATSLPETPSGAEALSEFLVRLRMQRQ